MSSSPESRYESPYIALGPFKVRLPFIHYKFELPDYLQGLLMCAVDLAAIPLMTELLGMPFEVALAVVMLNGLLYLTHHLLGDPTVPGWITPAVPLLIYCVIAPSWSATADGCVSQPTRQPVIAQALEKLLTDNTRSPSSATWRMEGATSPSR